MDHSPLTYLSRAMVYMEGVKYDSAVIDLTKAINDDTITNDLKIRCLYRRANSYIELKRYDDAIDDLIINLKLDPNHVATRALYAKALKMLLQLGHHYYYHHHYHHHHHHYHHHDYHHDYHHHHHHYHHYHHHL